MGALLLAALPACGGGGSASASVCDLRAQASDALGGSGPYAGREAALASDMRKASLPESSNADDAADLSRARSDAAAAIEAVAKVPKGDADALDQAQGEADRALAVIADNDACDAAVGAGAAAPGGPSAAAASTTGCPAPARPVAIGAPSPWVVIGHTGPEGQYRDMDVSESRVTVTNPNTVPVRAKVIALIGTPALATGSLFEYGVPSTRGLRSDGGLDYSVEAGMTVPPGASVEMAARMLTRTPTTVRALYGFADILAPNTDRPCNIPVAGAEPIKLLGGKTAGGCTDPAIGC